MSFLNFSLERIILITLILTITVSGQITKQKEDCFWFSSKLTHADTSENPAKIENCYFVKENYYFNPNKDPALILLTSQPVKSGITFSKEILNLARKQNALLLLLPIRYFGLEFEDKEFLSSENMIDLSITHIIGDIYQLTNHLIEEHFFGIDPRTSFILLGSGYLGSICLYARMRIPLRISGCIADSPLLSAEGEFYQYDAEIYKTLNSKFHSCPSIFRRFTQEVEVVLASTSYKEFLRKFREPFQKFSKIEVLNFVQAFISELIEEDNTGQFCMEVNKFLDNQTNIFDLFAQITARGIPKGFNFQESLELSNHSQNPKRLWLWLQCTEFGLFRVSAEEFKSEANGSIASAYIDYKYFQDKCRHVFEDVSDSDLFFNFERTNTEFNLKLGDYENVVVVGHPNSPEYRAMLQIRKVILPTIDCDSCFADDGFIVSKEEESEVWNQLSNTITQWLPRKNLQ